MVLSRDKNRDNPSCNVIKVIAVNVSLVTSCDNINNLLSATAIGIFHRGSYLLENK